MKHFFLFSAINLKRFTRCIKIIMLVLLAPLPAFAMFGNDLSAVFRAAASGDYQPAGAGIENDVALWLALNAGNGQFDFSDYAHFTVLHPDWPGMNALRVKAENIMPGDMADGIVIDWFKTNPPQTTFGALRYADALIRSGQRDAAHQALRKHLVDGNVTTDGLEKLQASHLLASSDFYARASRLIWDGRHDDARTVLPFLNASHKALVKARLALAGGAKDAAKLVAAVSGSKDEGLLFERLRNFRKQNNNAQAMALLRQQPAAMAKPDAWALERSILVRRFMDEGRYAEAYQLAAHHGYREGQAYANQEWIAGWLALRYLNKQPEALQHFANLYNKTGTPISKSRGAYWQGRVYQSMGQYDKAAPWFMRAAEYATTFYGQVAARTLGRDPVEFLPAETAPSPEDQNAFASDSRIQAARVLAQNGMQDKAALFLRSFIWKAERPADFVQAAQLGNSLNMPQIAVTAGKAAAQKNIQLPVSGYPVLRDASVSDTVHPALVHALIRQESEFNAQAASKAGAQGLMQLMPATARTVADKIGLDHDPDELTSNPAYNIKLGSSYFAQRLNQYSGSIVLAAAAYNGGARNVDQWIQQYGDPRDPKIDIIDWIENIPFYETRNYVQRVVENTEVYRMRLK